MRKDKLIAVLKAVAVSGGRMDRIDISQLEPVVPEPEPKLLTPGIRPLTHLDRAAKVMVLYRDADGQFCTFRDPRRKSQFMVMRPLKLTDYKGDAASDKT